MPMLREVRDVFLDELTAVTPLPGPLEVVAEIPFPRRPHQLDFEVEELSKCRVQTAFLLVHYTIEKHREALFVLPLSRLLN